VVPSGIDRRGIGFLSAGHACVDMCQGAVPALLPFLIAQRGYSYGAASALVLTYVSPGVYDNGHGSLYFQFSHLLSVLMAQARWLGGDRAIFLLQFADSR